MADWEASAKNCAEFFSGDVVGHHHVDHRLVHSDRQVSKLMTKERSWIGDSGRRAGDRIWRKFAC